MNGKRILFVAGCLAAVAVVAANLGPAADFAHVLHRLNLAVLSLVVVVQLTSYYFQAKFHQSFLDIFGHHVGMRKLYELSLAINFTDVALPSFGISGASLLANGLKGEVPPGRSALAHLFRFFFIFLTFPVILLLGFLMLYLSNDIGLWGTRLILLLVAGILAAMLLALPLLGRRQRAEQLVFGFVRLLNRIARRFGKPELLARPAVTEFLDEFYTGYYELWTHKRSWTGPLAYAFAINAAEVTTAYVIFWAFGARINPGAAIVSYALANMLSQIGFVTGGLIVYEGIMIGTYVGLGIPWALAASATISYRVVSLFLFLLPGIYYYRKYLR